jgi:cell division protein FtsB
MGRLLHFRRRDGKPWARGVPSDAHLDTLFPSDARPADEPPPGKAPDPERERRRRFRRGVVTLFLGTVFIASSGAALVGSRGYLGVRRARQELAELQGKVDAKQAEVMDIKKQVDRLKSDPQALERIARERLGFVKAGEVTFLLPNDEDRGPGARLLLPPPAVRTKSAVVPQDQPRD